MSTIIVPPDDPHNSRYDLDPWRPNFPWRYGLPVKVRHRGLGIRAERRTMRQWLRALIPVIRIRS